MLHSKVLPLLFLSFASVIALCPYDFCELEDGTTGQCIHILDCPPAQEDLKRRKRPIICGFDGLYTIVCCSVFITSDEYVPIPYTFNNQPTSVSFQVPDITPQLDSRGEVTSSTPLGSANILQQPQTTDALTSSISIDINNVTQQPQTRTTPTSSSSLGINNEPFTSQLITESQFIPTEASVMTTDFSTSLKTELPSTETETSVMTTEFPSSSTEELSEKKCQEYLNFVIPTTPSPFGNANQFVVGGVRTVVKEFPHMAALGYGETTQLEWQCGGSLISEQFVLTAAHCLSSRNLGDVKTVRLGDLSNYSTLPSVSRQDINVTATYAHPDYISNSHYNDIALLKLDRPINFTGSVRPACLQRNFEIDELVELTTTGWGADEFGGSTKSFLQKGELYNLPVNNCNVTYGPQRMLDRGFDVATQICGGNLMKRVDTCQGDSGGPLQSLIMASRLSYRIVGVTSFGKNCGLVPGIYTRVSSYIPWIESIVWENQI